jgi:hypothetical protein
MILLGSVLTILNLPGSVFIFGKTRIVLPPPSPQKTGFIIMRSIQSFSSVVVSLPKEIDWQ